MIFLNFIYSLTVCDYGRGYQSTAEWQVETLFSHLLKLGSRNNPMPIRLFITLSSNLSQLHVFSFAHNSPRRSYSYACLCVNSFVLGDSNLHLYLYEALYGYCWQPVQERVVRVPGAVKMKQVIALVRSSSFNQFFFTL